MTEELPIVNQTQSGVVFVAILAQAGLMLSVLLWGIPGWVPILTALAAAGLMMRGFSGNAILFVGLAIVGMFFASVLFGLPPEWVFALLGVLGVLLIAIHLSTPRGGGDVSMGGGSGDQNPIPMLLATIGIRAWLFAFNATGSTIGDEAMNPLTWLVVIVFGVVPSFPILVNILLFIATNGSLILWLVLLNKRIVNPLAN